MMRTVSTQLEILDEKRESLIQKLNKMTQIHQKRKVQKTSRQKLKDFPIFEVRYLDLSLPKLESKKQTKEQICKNKGSQAVPTTPNQIMIKKKVPEYIPKRLKVKLEQIELKNRREDGSKILGGDWTFLALKNPTSFLIGTKGRGLKMVEDGKEIFTSNPSSSFRSLLGMIYIETKDYYLMGFSGKIYRKNIDSKDPYLFIDLKVGVRIGACFRFSKLNNRLIATKDKHWISVINPETKKIDIEVKNLHGKSIWDFRLCDKSKGNVISLTKDGHLHICTIEYLFNRGYVTGHMDLELHTYAESASSLTVCEKNQYAVVQIKNSRRGAITRMIILGFNQHIFFKKAEIDLEGERIPEQLAFGCYGYAAQKILWVGLSTTRYGCVHVFEYDTQSEELRELIDKRVENEEIDPVSFHRYDNWYYYTGSSGKLMRFKLKF